MGAKIYTKTDTSENWAKAANFIPKDGELIYYSDTQQTKIGDGKTKVNELGFTGQTLNMEYNPDNYQLTINWK